MPPAPPRYEELAAPLTLLADLRGARCGSTTVIAVDGPSGSGKTDVVAALAPRLDARVLSMEDLYRGWQGLDASTPVLVGQILGCLAEDRTATFRRWDWEASAPGEPVPVEPGGVLILDGVGSGASLARTYLSGLLWLEAPEAVRKRRALQRDGATYEPWWDVWAEQEREHFARERTREAADLVVATA
ncbi:(d)CMP kinase [Aeromicrobium sp. IC_218]|uniref:(d)CMP kinase n=1 Tax=Aeromicrobium sp. IC_218 TaxID=2545468 RepID=UPI0013F3DAB6|nr:(d)CMP kinase [Aeromicrobium sp. IC_218]